MAQVDDLVAAVAAVKTAASAEIARLEALIASLSPAPDPRIDQAISDLTAVAAELNNERP
jgi:hypothetical protein